ncbi:MAG: ROK family protein [Verrucomicrobia bacterium]|nr:ROK family protein [Verrucomicrobiota bacterium]MBU4247918.1 ROK family protein [Verrucomicrobiota bacterium]MBU4289517.1 ROK family protein [Verrucomicrobiota bacterium]MBU4497709.1 ROK family protein [Verrucomicrobiota bacterium]MCG2680528.1 ROK family protein [Kiritimatiellia bacterium]
MKASPQRLAVGIDFGGTGVKMGLVDETGVIRGRFDFPTAAAGTRQAWMDQVQFGLDRFRRNGCLPIGIGVGVPGFTDFKRGFIYNLTNVPGWNSVYLARMLTKRFGLPAFVENDVNAMAIGECAYGAGRGHRHAVFATLGTGVGGGVVIDGKLYRGAYSMAGEIGHIAIRMNGHKTPEGQGGLETYIGNRQIVSRTVRALRAGRRSLIRALVKNDLGLVTPKIIARAATRNDPLALEIFDFVADCLATAFASITYLLQPEVIIVGGGVAQSGRVLFDPLRRHLRERLNQYFAKRIKVIPAKLGERAGMTGCAVLVFQSL